ncbi:MAG: efflux RND transporter periplasmic adaptor subunit [Pirellulales bacterium]
MRIRLLLTAALLMANMGAAPGQRSATPGQARLERCLVSLIEDVEVPASEAGQLVAVEAREGLQVEAGALLARINDDQPQHMRKIALAEQKAAEEQASNDVKVRYSKALTAKSGTDYRDTTILNRRSPGTISASEERRKLLELRAAELQVEQAELDQRVAKFTAESKSSELAAADTAIARRQILAPISGMVVETHKKLGEWVQPGETVLRIVRLDRLRVEGFLNASEHNPHEVMNRPVLVEVPLAHGRVEQFRGKVVFVSPLVEADGEFRVWAEVVNRTEGDQWLLLPGLNAAMSIELGRTLPPAREAQRPVPTGRR